MKNPIKRFLLRRLVRKDIEQNVRIKKEGVIEFGGIVAGFKDSYNEKNATLQTNNYGRISFDEAITLLNIFCNELYYYSNQLQYINQITDKLIDNYPKAKLSNFRACDTLSDLVKTAYRKVKEESCSQQQVDQAIENMRRYNGED